MVERNGNATSRSITNVNGITPKNAIRQTVDKSSTIMTDEWKSYLGIGKHFEGGHEIVNHSQQEYVCGNVITNTVESYFAIMKRGVVGVYLSISKQHLDKYCYEFSFRWNMRFVNDGKRTAQAIRGSIGKRLIYGLAHD